MPVNNVLENVDVRHKQVIKTAEEWAASELILLSGELGYDSTNKIIKTGNGRDNWANLPNLNNAFSYDAEHKRLILQ